MSDSLFLSETAKNSARYEALYEKEKQERQISQLEYKSRNQRVFAIVITAVLLLIIVLLWLMSNRRVLINKQKTSELLHELQTKSYRDVLNAENKERKRIASELHDGLGQLLSSAKMHLSVAEQNPDVLKKVQNTLDDAVKEVRHISHNLMPASLNELGLVAAIRQMTRTMSPDGNPRIDFSSTHYTSTPDEHEIALYRIVQELLVNSIKHGQSNFIEINLQRTSKEVYLEFKDNGSGFDPNDQNKRSGIGLKNILARTEMFQGQFEIESASGKGSTFRIHLPL